MAGNDQSPGFSLERNGESSSGPYVDNCKNTPPQPNGATSNMEAEAVMRRYGGLDPENEETLQVIEYVSDDGLRYNGKESKNILPSDTDGYLSKSIQRSDSQYPASGGHFSFLSLPNELIDHVLSYLSPVYLTAVRGVCRDLNKFASSDVHWQRHVQSNIPGYKVNSAYPCKSFRELYVTHEPHWFIPKYKIWFCDQELTGKLVIARYDQRRGCIEGYQLLATRDREGIEPWIADREVHIHYFDPKVKLHLDKPVLQFNARDPYYHHSSLRQREGSDDHVDREAWFERPMVFDSRTTDPRFSNFLLAKPLPPASVADKISLEFPYGYVWPPPAIPARHRVAGQPTRVSPIVSRQPSMSSSMLWAPGVPSEASDQTFRIRQWMEGLHTLGVHVGEEVVTYSTLDPVLYTPTEEKPWRGIWVGDYSGHGCEFLLINQPDNEDDLDREPLVRREQESDEDYEKRILDDKVYRGRLEAIKLTGDANVPRGEYTFVADDLGQNGFVGVAQDMPFRGTRIVHSKGHVAGMGFYHDKYIESQLLLISHNRLAQYWVGFGHISFFERVQIDPFLVP